MDMVSLLSRVAAGFAVKAAAVAFAIYAVAETYSYVRHVFNGVRNVL